MPVPSALLFLSPLSFFSFLFLFSHIFILYSLFCSAWAILLLFFVSLLFCTIVGATTTTSVNFYAVWQCLNDIHIRSVCQSCPSTPYPSWLLHLLPRIAVAVAGAGGESPARNELIQIQSHTVESAGYNVLYIHISFSFIVSFPLLVPLY